MPNGKTKKRRCKIENVHDCNKRKKERKKRRKECADRIFELFKQIGKKG
jgi:hypothetical protein